MRGLYAIVDVDALASTGQGPVEFASEVLRARPTALQLRAKQLDARATLALLERLKGLCRAAKVAFFCNDRVDLAIIAGCDGVHVGQHDLDVPAVRRVGPELLVGVSTHDLMQLDAALALRPTYVAFGPVYATHSKEQPDPVVGLSALAEASQRCRRAGIPLVAIGGLNLERASEVAPFVEAGALIGALCTVPGAVQANARALHRALGGS